MFKMGFNLIGIILFIPVLSFASIHAENEKTTLSGTITDHATGETLPGVNIYIPDLKTGTISNFDGTYKIENLPSSKVLVQVTLTGYKLISEIIDLEVTRTHDFALEEAVNELHEIVVTGLSNSAEKNRTPTPISTIPRIELLQNTSTNIMDAIARQPGISQVTTGVGISKPVIRGLGYNRVVTVMDGVRQEGQQWGDEHGIEVDEYAVNKVEILKGPASLTYGSDAMAGVINLLTAPTLPEGQINGNILVNYQTNNGLIGYSANVSGNKRGFIWDIRYSGKNAHAYQNKYDGYVLNSGFKESTVGGIAGLNKSWGYSHLHFSAYHLTPGIIEGDRDDTTGEFIKPIALNDSTEINVIAGDEDFKSYVPLLPYQQIHHYKAVLNNSFIVGDGSLKATIGFQQNRRQEYADVLNEDQYGLYFLLNTINYDIRYNGEAKNNFTYSFGANGMQQSSQNKGIEFLIPAYDLFDIGFFVSARKTIDKLDLSGGIRYDVRDETGNDLYLNGDGQVVSGNDPEAYRQFTAFHSIFTGISGSVGATYQFSETFFTKLNISRGFRAPNIAELSANGVHEGTFNYIIGDPSLKPETSLQLDYALGVNTIHLTAEASVFASSIDHYIFQNKLESTMGGDSLTDGYSTFKFVSGVADLTGGEITIDIHPHPFDWLHFENSFSYVSAQQRDQPDSTKYLPSIPPAKWSSELKATAGKVGTMFTNAYAMVEFENYWAQNRFYSAFNTETATRGYALLNIGIGTDVISKKGATLFSLYINANNITNVAYQSHLSRLKYADINTVTGRTGVYNMGRNISFKLLVPLTFSGQ